MSSDDRELVTYFKGFADGPKMAEADAYQWGQTRAIAILGGLHRSGTTLLFRMLREHPDISGFANNEDPEQWLGVEDEGQFLQSVYPPAFCFGGPGRFALSPQAHLTDDSPLLTTENKAKLAFEWFPYFDLSKKVLLEKS